jgi:hypothetical protein
LVEKFRGIKRRETSFFLEVFWVVFITYLTPTINHKGAFILSNTLVGLVPWHLIATQVLWMTAYSWAVALSLVRFIVCSRKWVWSWGWRSVLIVESSVWVFSECDVALRGASVKSSYFELSVSASVYQCFGVWICWMNQLVV